jgi:transposase
LRNQFALRTTWVPTPDPAQFKSGRQFAAWIGLTPIDHSTAGKVSLGGMPSRPAILALIYEWQ